MTREHVPPKSALNDGIVSVHTLYSVARGWSRGQLFQNGMTRSALCNPCNWASGKHYVGEFAHWTLQAAEYRHRLCEESRVLLPFHLNALAVVKQLAVMTLAMSETESIDLPHFLELRRFVLSPKRISRTSAFRFHTYFHFGAPAFNGPFCATSMSSGPAPMVFCHFGREPLGYITTVNDGGSVEWAKRLRLCDITGFAFRDPGVRTVEHLWIPCLRGKLPFQPSSGPHVA